MTGIDLASAAAVVTAANRASELLTARYNADPSDPIAPELLILADRATELATEYTQLITHHERRTA